MGAAAGDGETRWVDLVEHARAGRGEVEAPSKAAEAAGDKLKAKIADVKAKQQAKAAEKAAAAPATDKSAPPPPAAKATEKAPPPPPPEDDDVPDAEYEG